MKIKTFCAIILISVFNYGCTIFGLDRIHYKVKPSTLTYQGGNVGINLTIEYPKYTLHKKLTAELIPVLKYRGGEKAFKPILLKGEKAEGSGIIINRSGGTIEYTASIPFEAGMFEAELHVKGKQFLKGDREVGSCITKEPIALGTITTPLLWEKGETFSYGKNNLTPITLTKKANIYFAYNSFNIRPAEKDSISKGTFNSFVDLQIKNGGTFKNVEITAWSAPSDFEEGLNNELSTKRAGEVTKYIQTYFKGKNVTPPVTNKGGGTDMNGFNAIVNGKNFPGLTELIKKVKEGAKNTELKSVGNEAYNKFEKEILTPLRKAEVKLTVIEKPKSNSELSDLAKNNPKQLTLEELLYTTETILTDDAEKMSVLQQTINHFPNDWRAYNNMGIIYANQGKLDDALLQFQKAEKVSGTEQAIKINMGNIYIQKGNYDLAVKAFGAYNSFNAALANLLAGYPEKVDAIIDGSAEKEKAVSYYLKAITAARMNNIQKTIDHLKIAIAKDPELKTKAKGDLEFFGVRDNEDFKTMVH